MKLLNKLDERQQKQKLNEIIRQKNLMFYQEQKFKQLAKIKSKLYHRIKKKKQLKEQLKQLQNLDPQQKEIELEKLREQRAKERITQKHQTKTKTFRNLLRYGDNKQVLDTINEVNQHRQELLRKINAQQEDLDSASDDLAENNEKQIREKAIEELENQLEQGAEDQDEGKIHKTGVKFLDEYAEKQNQQAREEIHDLLNQLREEQDIENIHIDGVEEGEEKSANKKQNEAGEVDPEDNEEEFVGRKKFKKAEP